MERIEIAKVSVTGENIIRQAIKQVQLLFQPKQDSGIRFHKSDVSFVYWISGLCQI